MGRMVQSRARDESLPLASLSSGRKDELLEPHGSRVNSKPGQFHIEGG